MSDLNSRDDLISRQALCQYALNQKDKSVTPNDIMRFPTAEPKTKCIAQIRIDPDDMEDLVNEKVNEIVDKMAEPKTGWIPVNERLPKCEQEVLICTEKKLVGKDACIDSIITPAIYEDGTMLEVESMWRWDDIDFDEWDDTEDCGIIPMGWFENRHFNPDEVYNNPVDRKVVAWMPLPEPYKGGVEDDSD